MSININQLHVHINNIFIFKNIFSDIKKIFTRVGQLNIFVNVWLNRREVDSHISPTFSVSTYHTSCSFWKTPLSAYKRRVKKAITH